MFEVEYSKSLKRTRKNLLEMV